MFGELFTSMRVSHKMLVISLSFSLPIAVLLYFVTLVTNKDIEFARKEMAGNEYQRPLEKLLEHIPLHWLSARRSLAGEKGLDSQLHNEQSQTDDAFTQLEAVDQRIGQLLQFTTEGLGGKRKREHFRVKTVKAEWDELKGSLGRLDVEESNKRHLHLIDDIKMMITHSGDTSNLILDPDLDSYYLMDITLLALPQTQDRLAKIIAEGSSILRQTQISPKDRVQLAVFGNLLRESDADRVRGSTNSASRRTLSARAPLGTMMNRERASVAGFSSMRAWAVRRRVRSR